MPAIANIAPSRIRPMVCAFVLCCPSFHEMRSIRSSIAFLHLRLVHTTHEILVLEYSGDRATINSAEAVEGDSLS
jgi:hypothetical protein